MHSLARLAKWLLPILFIGLATLSALGFVYIAGELSSLTRRQSSVVYLDQTTPRPLPPTPLVPLEVVNPAVLEALQQRHAEQNPPEPFGIDVIPVGAYLPVATELAPEVVEGLTLPTQFPYPTTPPLPPDAALNVDPCAPRGFPADGDLTQGYQGLHLAVDIGVHIGTPVTATHSGIVVYAGWSDVGYGNVVIIKSGAFVTYYAHNTGLNVVVGDAVRRGETIAFSGNTGNSSGPHLHYETRVNDRPVDPLTFESRGYETC